MVLVTTDAAGNRTMLAAMRHDRTFADVVLVVGESKTKVTAHAVALASACEYYKEALSLKWRANRLSVTVTPSSPLQIEQGEASTTQHNAIFKASVAHPDADEDTVKTVLDFIYTGECTVEDALLVRVAVFADQILLHSLSQQCLAHLLDGGLSPVNAIEFYVLSDIENFADHRGLALLHAMKDLGTALAHGRLYLADMDVTDVSNILSFPPLSALDRWTIVVAWVKARQGIDTLAIADGVDLRLSLPMARDDMAQLLPVVGIYSLALELYDSVIVPYIPLIPQSHHQSLAFHYRPKTSVQKDLLRWGKSIHSLDDSKILTIQASFFLKEKLKKHIKLFVNGNGAGIGNGIIPNSNASSFRPITPSSSPGSSPSPTPLLHHQAPASYSSTLKWNLLFRASTSSFSNAHFHKICDGKRHTLLLVKTVNGKVIGAYADAAWDGARNSYIPVQDAFLFSVTQASRDTSVAGFVFERHPCLPGELYHGLYGSASGGPAFGVDDLYVNGSVCRSHVGSYAFEVGQNGGTFLGSSERDGKYFSVRIAEYEVFQLE